MPDEEVPAEPIKKLNRGERRAAARLADERRRAEERAQIHMDAHMSKHDHTGRS